MDLAANQLLSTSSFLRNHNVSSDSEVILVANQIKREIIPNRILSIRHPLVPMIGRYNDDLGEFKVYTEREISENQDQIQYLIEVPSASLPEFVLEYLKSPFIKTIDKTKSSFRCLEKSLYPSLLKISNILRQTLSENLSKLNLSEFDFKTYQVEFFLNNISSIIETQLDSVLQIVISFEVE